MTTKKEPSSSLITIRLNAQELADLQSLAKIHLDSYGRPMNNSKMVKKAVIEAIETHKRIKKRK